jgi:hypothetical protein
MELLGQCCGFVGSNHGPAMATRGISTLLPVGRTPGSIQSISLVWVNLNTTSSTIWSAPTARLTGLVERPDLSGRMRVRRDEGLVCLHCAGCGALARGIGDWVRGQRRPSGQNQMQEPGWSPQA